MHSNARILQSSRGKKKAYCPLRARQHVVLGSRKKCFYLSTSMVEDIIGRDSRWVSDDGSLKVASDSFKTAQPLIALIPYGIHRFETEICSLLKCLAAEN